MNECTLNARSPSESWAISCVYSQHLESYSQSKAAGEDVLKVISSAVKVWSLPVNQSLFDSPLCISPYYWNPIGSGSACFRTFGSDAYRQCPAYYSMVVACGLEALLAWITDKFKKWCDFTPLTN